MSVAGNYAYVGHITNKQRLGTSILDVSDPREPRLVSQIRLDDPDSHSHKARVAGDLMIVNVEQNQDALGRKTENLAGYVRTGSCPDHSARASESRTTLVHFGIPRAM